MSVLRNSGYKVPLPVSAHFIGSTADSVTSSQVCFVGPPQSMKEAPGDGTFLVVWACGICFELLQNGDLKIGKGSRTHKAEVSRGQRWRVRRAPFPFDATAGPIDSLCFLTGGLGEKHPQMPANNRERQRAVSPQMAPVHGWFGGPGPWSFQGLEREKTL